jgi:hypothetical protein
MRKTITFLVASGYDVLFFDKRGHGYSEGVLDGMGEDVFRALDQLDRGTIIEDGITLSLKVITADGRTLQGQAAASERLLGDRYTAKRATETADQRWLVGSLMRQANSYAWLISFILRSASS